VRILHIIPGLTVERGGPSTVLDALTRHQVRAGHAVSVLTTDQGARHGERSLQLDSRVVVLRCRVAGPDRVAYAPGLRRAAQGLLRRADVLHLHSIFTYPIHAALSEAQRASVPVILRPCGLLHQYSLKRTHLAKSLYLGWKGRTISETVAAWHYTSPNEAAESWPPGNRRQFVLGNGVDPDEFALDRNLARDRVAARWPQLAGFRYILFMARLHPKKRVDLLLNAFLAAELENFKLVVAGPDEEHLWEPLSRRLLARSTDRDRVLRLGTVVGDARRQLLAGAAAFALPSEHENFGVAALEALAAGTPVLLSPHVDLSDAVAAARCGTTVPLEPLKWTEQLMALASRPEPSEQFVTSCRDWVSANYSWQRIASRLQQHYQELQSHCDGSAA
jgi:glycosyltransferase involved in cell wall biosynthesis